MISNKERKRENMKAREREEAKRKRVKDRDTIFIQGREVCGGGVQR